MFGIQFALSNITLSLSLLLNQAVAEPYTFKSSCKASNIGVKIAQANPGAIVNVVTYVSAGDTVAINVTGCAAYSAVAPVDFCRVALNYNTSSTSRVYTEHWLPKDWSGRFLGTGNGGIGGCE